MESKFPEIQLKADIWKNIISGWKKGFILLDESTIKLYSSRATSPISIKEFSLLEVKIYDEKKKKQFYLYSNKKKYYIKLEKEEDKILFISKAKEYTIELMKKTNIQPIEFENDNPSNEKDTVKLSKRFLSQIIKNIETIDSSIESLQEFEQHIKHIEERTKYREELNKLIIKISQVQKVFTNIINFEDNYITISTSNENENIKEEDLKVNLNLAEIEKDLVKEEKKEIDENDSVSSSDDERAKIEEIKSSCEIISESSEKIEKFKNALSDIDTEFFDEQYEFQQRTELPCKIKCPENYVKGMIKSMTNKKGSMPISYNEPISMLQKQCEKFYYSNFLYIASKEEVPSELKIIYIFGFICAELSLSIGRFLKPFNPILGETFEYFDNKRKFRYFSEQVSHNPPISAYICENSLFVFFGDTRVKTSFKFLKGALEIEYTNKTHLLFKNTHHSYIFTKPKTIASGFVTGNPKYDNEGTLIIKDTNDQSIYGEIVFKEDKSGSKKDLNDVDLIEGTVYKDNKPIYKIKGNWKDNVYYTDINGNNREDIWTLKKEKYMSNTMEEYCMPDYSMNLNAITNELVDVLPHTDTRMRPDQRLFEVGRIEEAETVKTEIENNQRKRHLKFDEEKIKYEPIYFNNIFDEKSEDFVYVYKGGYFEERSKGEYSNKEKIFETENIKSENLTEYVKNFN